MSDPRLAPGVIHITLLRSGLVKMYPNPKASHETPSECFGQKQIHLVSAFQSLRKKDIYTNSYQTLIPTQNNKNGALRKDICYI